MKAMFKEQLNRTIYIATKFVHMLGTTLNICFIKCFPVNIHRLIIDQIIGLMCSLDFVKFYMTIE